MKSPTSSRSSKRPGRKAPASVWDRVYFTQPETAHKLAWLNEQFMKRVRLVKHHKSHFGTSVVWWDIWNKVNEGVPLEVRSRLITNHRLK